MNLQLSSYKTVVAAAIVSIVAPLCAQAKTVNFLGVTNDGQRGRIKARIETGNKNVTSVTSYSYSMKDGYTIVSTDYDLVKDGSDTFVSADVFYYPDRESYTYRLQLTFDDGSTYTSEVVNEELTEAFVWLGDVAWAAAEAGWNTPVVDKEVDPSQNLMLDNVRYYKGVSNHANGYFLYKFSDAPYTSFVTRYGVHDNMAEGDVNFKFYTSTDIDKTTTNNMTLVEEKVMFSMQNPGRNGAPCAADLDIPMDGVKVLRIQLDRYDSENYGDHANLMMPRLYLPSPVSAPKQKQEIVFKTQSGTLSEDGIRLEATSTSGGNIHYSIISGREAATLEGDFIKPVWGAKGIVIVEATQFGDDTYQPATSYISFNVDMSPRMELLDFHTSVTDGGTFGYAYLLVDTKGRPLNSLSAQIFSDPRKLNPVTTVDLLGDFDVTKGAQVIEIPLNDFVDQVLRVKYRFDGTDAEVTMPYWHREGSYDYASDKTFTSKMGYGSFPGANNTYNGMNNNQLAIGSADNTYAKGFNIHADGYIEIPAATLTPYERLVADVGGQYPPRYGVTSTEKLAFELLNGNIQLAKTEDVIKATLIKWDFPVNNQQKIQIMGHPGSDGNGGDYVCFGAVRLYYTRTAKTPQAITWTDRLEIIENKPSTITLNATSESGFPIFYYLVSGAEYASLDGNRLNIREQPSGGADIVVEAVQPGNDTWGMAPVATCTFHLTRGLEVQKNEYVELKANDVYDKLIVHADKSGSGQVALKDALVDIRTLVLKYTFNPGEWVHIAFPADLDIDKVSNLGELGYTYNAFAAPAYYLKEFDTEAFATDPLSSPWKMLERPIVTGNKGYIMSLDGSAVDEPVEVTFTVSNTNVDLTTLMRSFGLSLDLRNMEPNSTKKITVSSDDPDILSNNLTIDVTFSPSDMASLPINHRYALDNMRFVFVNGHKAIRLTLPDQSPARVVFFDNDGKKIVKAVRYIAPNVINLAELKNGHYNMVVSYGEAVKTFPIEIHD